MTDRRDDDEMPQFFTKKPVTIEAIQYTGNNYRDVLEFFNNADAGYWHVGTIKIYTLEGTMDANPGDWIIKGIKGEFYPCKPDIFEATYSHAARPSQPADDGEVDVDALIENLNKARNMQGDTERGNWCQGIIDDAIDHLAKTGRLSGAPAYSPSQAEALEAVKKAVDVNDGDTLSRLNPDVKVIWEATASWGPWETVRLGHLRAIATITASPQGSRPNYPEKPESSSGLAQLRERVEVIRGNFKLGDDYGSALDAVLREIDKLERKSDPAGKETQ